MLLFWHVGEKYRNSVTNLLFLQWSLWIMSTWGLGMLRQLIKDMSPKSETVSPIDRKIKPLQSSFSAQAFSLTFYISFYWDQKQFDWFGRQWKDVKTIKYPKDVKNIRLLFSVLGPGNLLHQVLEKMTLCTITTEQHLACLNGKRSSAKYSLHPTEQRISAQKWIA